MGKGKLVKFAQMETFENVLQYPFGKLQSEGFPHKGKWRSDIFKNDNPVILELGCGKGDYAVGLGKMYPDINFIGIDIKGARIWKGAKQALEDKLDNVRFLRTSIELVAHFFDANEVDEIWLTFPDPQMMKPRKRLTATNFLENYRKFLKADGAINLKTDSGFQYGYTLAMAEHNQFVIEKNYEDIYKEATEAELLNIQTYYEEQWLGRDKTIKYLRFLVHSEALFEPNKDIEFDDYRSYGRDKRSALWSGK